MQMFGINEIVTILEYVGDAYNERGRVQAYNEEKDMYWVANMNMPFMGTVSSWYTSYELESINA